MERLDKLIASLKEFDKNVLSLIEVTVKDNEHIILDMNFKDQLYDKGIDRDGLELSSFMPYAPMTIEIKRAKGQPTNRVTLRDEGDFYRSGFIEYGSDYFAISADDVKTQKLIEKYGAEILGLTDYNVAEFARDYILPQIEEHLTDLKNKI